MLDLDALAVLVAVDHTRTVSAAARSLGVPKATAWRRLLRLEEQVGGRLVERTPKHQRLTAAGLELAARGRGLLQEAQTALAAAREQADGTQGVLKVGLPPGTHPSILVQAMAQLRLQYPGVRIWLYESAAPLHPLRDDLDLIITLDRPSDGDLYVQLLDSVEWRLMAAPSYLERCPAPGSAEDLHTHTLLAFYLPPRLPTHWRLRAGGALQVAPLLATTNAEAVAQATAAGLGIGYLPWSLATIRAPLVPVLPHLVGESGGLFLVAGQRSRDSARVRLIQSLFNWARSQSLVGPLPG